MCYSLVLGIEFVQLGQSETLDNGLIMKCFPPPTHRSPCSRLYSRLEYCWHLVSPGSGLAVNFCFLFTRQVSGDPVDWENIRKEEKRQRNNGDILSWGEIKRML